MVDEEIATIEFSDVASGDEAVAIVRAGSGYIALALSLRRDGDIEVVMRPTDCQALVQALTRALGAVQAKTT